MNRPCFAHLSVALVLALILINASAGQPPAPTEAELPVIPPNTVELTAFGGVGDGKFLNTDAFEKAFAALAEKGGGKIIVPPGIWLTGPIRFRSHTDLHLERGALIQFSRDFKLYPLTVIDRKDEKEVDSLSPISGVNLENVATAGDGILGGGGDGICIKSGKDAAGRRIGVPTENVLVQGCTVYHAHGGFTIGSEMSGGVKNPLVTNCAFIGTDVGLRFKSTRGRGGVVEKIFINGIRMENISSDAINFDPYYGGKSVSEKSTVTEETPAFKEIHAEDLVCRGARNAVVLQGLPEMPLRDITLKNVSITSERGVSVTDAENISFENVHVENRSGDALKTLRVKNSQLDLLK